MAGAKTYWLSSIGPGHVPHTRPIDGMWIDDELYFGGSEQSRWRKNLIVNREVCINLEDGVQAVILHGRVNPLVCDADLAKVLAAAANEKYPYGQTAKTYDGQEVFCFRAHTVFAWKLLYEDATKWTLI